MQYNKVQGSAVCKKENGGLYFVWILHLVSADFTVFDGMCRQCTRRGSLSTHLIFHFWDRSCYYFFQDHVGSQARSIRTSSKWHRNDSKNYAYEPSLLLAGQTCQSELATNEDTCAGRSMLIIAYSRLMTSFHSRLCLWSDQELHSMASFFGGCRPNLVMRKINLEHWFVTVGINLNPSNAPPTGDLCFVPTSSS